MIPARIRAEPTRLRRAAAACTLAGLLACACAAPPAADPCTGSADEAALLACRQRAFADVSQRLRVAVDQLQQRYRDDEPERGQLLSAAQDAWRHYSEAECRFRHHESRPGRAYPAYLLSCLSELSERRLQDLQGVLATP